MTDCHSENIIAAGPSPVVIDAETVMSRTAGQDDPSKPLTDTLHGSLTAETVLGTAMLPVQIGNVDLSQAGLDGESQTRGGTKHVHWEDVNTDAMSIEYRYPESEQPDNLPLLDGERIPPDQFVPEVLAGFRRTYDAIHNASDHVTQYVWDRFTDTRLRVVVMATRVYDAITRTATNPSQLENGAIHSGTMEGTLVRKLDDEQLFGSQDIVNAERDALLSRDIPKFLTRARGDSLLVNYTPIDSFQFDRTPLRRVESTIRGMSSDDRAFQTGLIEACLTMSERPDGTHNTRGL